MISTTESFATYSMVGLRTGGISGGAMASASSMSSVDKALAVLEAFRGPGAILGVTEIARRSNLPKSTVHRLLALLAGRGYIERHGNRYRVGEVLFELGNLVSHCQPRGIRGTAMPFLMDLVRATSATVQLGVPSGDDVLIVEKIAGHRVVGVPTRVGSRLPLTQSALGRAVLAYRSRKSAVQPLPGADATVGPRHDKDELFERALGRVRETGFAYEVVNSTAGVLAVAAPIFEPHSDVPVAALSVAFRKSDVTTPHVENDLRHTAAAISRTIAVPASELA